VLPADRGTVDWVISQPIIRINPSPLLASPRYSKSATIEIGQDLPRALPNPRDCFAWWQHEPTQGRARATGGDV
jgi:hypothetical protein